MRWSWGGVLGPCCWMPPVRWRGARVGGGCGSSTNDNTAVLRFYQRAGWDLVGFHRNALAQSRVLKPSIPQMGLDSIPIRHELELELPLP